MNWYKLVFIMLVHTRFVLMAAFQVLLYQSTAATVLLEIIKAGLLPGNSWFGQFLRHGRVILLPGEFNHKGRR